MQARHTKLHIPLAGHGAKQIAAALVFGPYFDLVLLDVLQ